MNTAHCQQPCFTAARHAPAHRGARPRGVAVILALVAVGAAVVLSLALASTRDQGALTSDSIVRVAAARAASGGSLDIACALVEQHGLSGFDATTNPTPVLFSPVSIGSRTYSADVFDLGNSQPISSDTIAVRIVARAQSDGITQTATAIGRLVQHDTVVRADVDLSEFGLLTTTDAPDSISFADTSTLGTWEAAPLAQLREPVMIGSSRLNEDAVNLGGARLRGYTVLEQGEFPETDEESDEAIADRACPLPHEIHVPEAPRPGRSKFAHEVSTSDLTVDELSALLDPPSYVDPSVPPGLLAARGNLNLNGSVDLSTGLGMEGGDGANVLRITSPTGASGTTWRQIDISGDLVLWNDDELSIETPTLLIVRGNLNMNSSRIFVEANVPFSLVVFGEAGVDSSWIGPPSDSEGTNQPPAYGDGVARIMIYGTMDGRSGIASTDSSNRDFSFSRSIVAAQIYAPSRSVMFGDDSRLFGRALARTLSFGTNAHFLYDPALNEGRGWSNPTSGLWADESSPREEVLRIAELTDSAMSLGTADDGSGSPLDPEGPVVAIDAPAGGIIVPAHTAFLGGQERTDYEDEVIRSVLNNVSDPEQVKGGAPDEIKLAAIVRGFKEARGPSGHPDFVPAFETTELWQEIVQLALDGAGKPVYSGNPSVKATQKMHGSDPVNWSIALPTDTVEAIVDDSIEEGFQQPPAAPGGGGATPPVDSAETFALWFRDKPGLNMSMPAAISFVRQGQARSFTVDGTNNPAKGALFGDLPTLEEASLGVAPARSGNFTMEFAVEFKRDTSSPGRDQCFTVHTRGDALVYVNGTLVLEVVSKKGNPMQRQKVPMDRLPIANNAFGEIRVFYANRSSGDPAFTFSANFPMWQNVQWLEDAEFTPPAAAKTSIDRVAQRAAEAKSAGELAMEPTLFADRGVDWSRRIEPQGNSIVPAN